MIYKYKTVALIFENTYRAHVLHLKTAKLSYLEAINFLFLNMAHSRIWKKRHFTHLKMKHFPFFKMLELRNWNRHFFVFENCTFRILRLEGFVTKWHGKCQHSKCQAQRGQQQITEIWGEGFKANMGKGKKVVVVKR